MSSFAGSSTTGGRTRGTADVGAPHEDVLRDPREDALRGPRDAKGNQPPSVEADSFERTEDGAVDEGRWSAHRSTAQPASQVRADGVKPSEAVLRRTQIRVHGVELDVEYDARWASKSDVATVEQALNRYPPAWVKKAREVGVERREAWPTVRMLGGDGVKDEPEGRYDPESNTITLNMTKLAGQRGYLRDARGRPLQGRAWLERTAVHEFAHFLDDVGTEDTQGPLNEMASFVGPWQKRTAGRRASPGVRAGQVSAGCYRPQSQRSVGVRHRV